jgi:hypothetical protein
MAQKQFFTDGPAHDIAYRNIRDSQNEHAKRARAACEALWEITVQTFDGEAVAQQGIARRRHAVPRIAAAFEQAQMVGAEFELGHDLPPPCLRRLAEVRRRAAAVATSREGHRSQRSVRQSSTRDVGRDRSGLPYQFPETSRSRVFRLPR